MLIREATHKDIPDILALIHARADFDSCLEFMKSEEKEIEEAFFSETPKAKATVAEINNKS